MKNGVEEVKEYPNKLILNRDEMSSLEASHYMIGTFEEVPIDLIKKAPDDWNRFEPLSEEKMTELKSSIRNVGVLNPVILWDNGEGIEEGMKTCLSGHNRVEAYKQLQEEDFERYSSIIAIVKAKDDIDENMAQQIVIDTNITQRELSKIEKSRAFIKKFELLKERNDTKSEKNFTKILEKEFGITGRQIRKYKQLIELIPEFQDLIDEGKITIENGCHITRLNKVLQLELYNIVIEDESYLKALNKRTKYLKADFTKTDFINLITQEHMKNGTIAFEFLNDSDEPITGKFIYDKKHEESFVRLFKKFIKANTDEEIKYSIK